MNTKIKNYVVCIVIPAFIVFFLVFSLLLPDKEFSDSERRRLAGAPELTMHSITNGRFMTAFEKYVQDQFPLREQFRSIKSVVSTEYLYKKDNNHLYETEGYLAYMEYPLNEKSLEYAAGRFDYISEKYLTDDNAIYFSLIPDKNMILGSQSGHLFIDYKTFERAITEKIPYASVISIDDLLTKEDYYKTDTHFRQERIVDVAQRILGEMDAEILADYETVLAKEDFYGVYHGQMARNYPSEPMYYLKGGNIDEFEVYDVQNDKASEVYDIKRLEGKDPYEMYLSGPLSIVTIDNPRSDNNRNLIVFRDSFGSSIAPLLAEGYKKVTLIDTRYIHPDYLGQFVSFENSDILFLYSTLVLNNSETMK